MMYYYEKIKSIFLKSTKDPDLFQLNKLIIRCLKHYQMSDQVIKIFKLVQLKDKVEAKLKDKPIDEKLLELNQTMRKRVLVVIKLLLKENPILPTSFRFKGECLIVKLKREDAAYVDYQYTAMGLSTRRELTKDSTREQNLFDKQES